LAWFEYRFVIGNCFLKIRILDVHGTGDKTGHIHLSIGAKHNSIWVISHNCPFERKVPKMTEASTPVTRFRVAELEVGTINWVVFILPDIELMPIDNRLIRTLGDG